MKNSERILTAERARKIITVEVSVVGTMSETRHLADHDLLVRKGMSEAEKTE